LSIPVTPLYSSLFLPLSPPRSPLFPYTTLFRSRCPVGGRPVARRGPGGRPGVPPPGLPRTRPRPVRPVLRPQARDPAALGQPGQDRKSTRLNSSHGSISYAVFCLKKHKHNTDIR